MKLLKNSTYQNLLNENSVLCSANANLKSNLDIMSDKAVRLERKLIKVEKDSKILTEGIVRIEQEKSEIRKMYANELLKREHVISDLEKERLYVNLTRDKKGVLHSIVKKEKAVKKPVIVLSAKEFAEKYLGKRTKTDIGTGKICGYDPTDSSILVGFDDSLKGHGGSASNGVKLKEYPSYYWQHKDLIKLAN